MQEMVTSFLAGLACMIVGYIMIFRPDLVWKIEHIFTQKPYDPEKSYQGTLRMLGSLFVLMGLYMAMSPILETL